MCVCVCVCVCITHQNVNSQHTLLIKVGQKMVCSLLSLFSLLLNTTTKNSTNAIVYLFKFDYDGQFG